MKFGTFHILPLPEGTTAHGVIHETLAEAELAESLEFDTVWLAEHHSSRFGICASASVLGAAVAMRTRRVNIGYAVNVTPLHHPLRLAEEIALLDQLSDGRVIAGFGPGYAASEFELYGVPLDERHERHWEGVEVVLKAWGDDGFSHHGRHFDFERAGAVSTPHQHPYPPVAIAAGSPESASKAAVLRFRLLLLVGPEQIAELLATYRQAAAAAGHPSPAVDSRLEHTGVMRTICIAEDDGAARAAARQHATWLVTLRNQLSKTDASPEQLTEQVSQFLDQRTIAGCPERVVDGIQRVADVGGGEILGWFRWGTMTHGEVTASMRLFAEKVVPRVS